jgi:hypothetical protein
METPVPGTGLRTHRVTQSGWVRRDVGGLRDRYLYSVYETDDATERVFCDDVEMIALARLVESRLP